MAKRPSVVNSIRHISVFDPVRFGQTRVDVVGCGSVGSRIGMELGRLGVRNIHLWDDDRVEAHNLANQSFVLSDLDHFKVRALAHHIYAASGIEPTIHRQRIESKVEFGRVVIMALDSFASRRTVFETSIQYNPTVEFFIDTRMGVEEMRVYQIMNSDLDQVEAWEATIGDDAKSKENACQQRTTLGATAAILSGLAVHGFLQFYRRDFVRDPSFRTTMDFEQILVVRPLMSTTRK